MITVLKLKFKDNFGKAHYIKLVKPKKGLTKEVVHQAMNMMADAHLLKKDGQELTATPVGAKYVTTTEENIYSDEA